MNLRLLFIKNNLYQLLALIIRDIKLKSRYKAKLLFVIIVPFSTFLVPFLIFRKLFKAIGEKSFGIWTPENYIIFILTGIFIVALIDLLAVYGRSLELEKYWKTLPILFLSPLNLFNILASKLLSEMIIFIVPLSIVFIACFIITSASFLTIIMVFLIFFLAAIFIASIGLMIGSFRMSIEGEYRLFFLVANFFLIFSCYKYPKEFFPKEFEYFIIFNPFYYYWDIIRSILILGAENVLFNPVYNIHFIVTISFSSIGPILSVRFFVYIYKKYGLVGY